MKKMVLLLGGALLLLAGCETDRDWHHRGGAYGDDGYGSGHGYWRDGRYYRYDNSPYNGYPNYDGYRYHY